MTGGSEVFSMGCNLKGQLGVALVQHLKDVSKIESLSNYTMSTPTEKDKKVTVEQLECGNNHCIALLNIGYVMEWGDNEYGQMGNKKRSLVNRPIIVKEFIGKKVKGVFASHNSSGVII
jgi:alpha-tubulin suppressor-like RCC1 family protein